jgi:ATP adenylyltransferase
MFYFVKICLKGISAKIDLEINNPHIQRLRMHHIWSPWRMKYIENHNNNICPFCEAISSSQDTENLIINRGKNAFVMLNKYPYTSGHMLVLPMIHQEKLSDLSREIREELTELVNQASEVLITVYQPEGLNIGLNIGAAAGAGIPKHLHWHIVPRWVGDTNFITTVGGARVIPESLEDCYQKIKSAWSAR